MTQPQSLLGIHDHPGTYDLRRLFGDTTGWVLHTVSLKAGERVQLAGNGFGNIVRISWGYGRDGTIPAGDFADFAALCARWVSAHPGVDVVTIGNEPNHENERPDGQIITPDAYADCFARCYDAIKRVDARIRVIPAAVAPYHANPAVWTGYLARMLDTIGDLSGCDGINIHAYTRSHHPADIAADTMMGPPLDHTRSGFRTYLDALDFVPDTLRHLPAYITEFNPIQGWPGHNSGVIQAAAHEIERHNAQVGTQKIHALVCFRWFAWPPNPAWGMQDKPGTLEDFRLAVQAGHKPPKVTAAGTARTHNVYLPNVTVGAAPDAPSVPQPPLQWDDRLTARGVIHAQIVPNRDGPIWRLGKAEYLTEKEHIFVNTLDEQGKPLPGVEVICENGGQVVRVTEDKSGDPYALGMANFPMYSAGWAYSVRVAGGQSDTVRGMGLGSVEQPEMGIHVSYRLTFQRAWANASAPQPQKPAPEVRQPTLTPLPPTPVREEPMPSDTWTRSYAFVRRWEGGYQAVENDAGNWTGGAVGQGELKGTKYGISAASYPHLDIKNLTREQATEIYRRDYWQASGADKLPWPASLIVFDTAVLHGVGAAQAWQREVGTNALAFAAKRLRVYTDMHNWDYWGKAWVNRVADLLEEASRG